MFFRAAYCFPGGSDSSMPMLSITIDDPNTESSSRLSWQQKDDAILSALAKKGLQAALFVCGKRVDNQEGRSLLEKWDSAGHLICNHSYSHLYFHSNKLSLEGYEKDMLKCDSLISSYRNFTKLFRYPFLKEGNTIEKRDGFRKLLDSLDYKNGYVTIDASDWYISSRLEDTLKVNPDADITPYKEFYLDHMYKRALFYDSLAFQLTGRHIKHTMLLHHNLINALFIGQLIEIFQNKGWVFVNAKDAFNEELTPGAPDILPAGESLVWAMAKETGRYDDILRYPGEDAEYEKESLNFYLEQYKKR